MAKSRFKYDYKTRAQLAAMTAAQLLSYKTAMGLQADNIKAEASEWASTYKLLTEALEDRMIDLEAMLLGAALDRIESDEDSFAVVGYIH